MNPSPESLPTEEPDTDASTWSGRNLVVCCDGTNNQFGTRNTNVVRLVQCLERDTAGQLVYYDPGVGTLPDPNLATRAGRKISQVLGLAFGLGLTRDVTEAYEYLMEYWEPGDRVYIFGFSRGAYTARVLAGMLHTMGLLPKGGTNLLPYLLENYRAMSARGPGGGKQQATCDAFRRTFARSVPGDSQERHFPTHFLGVWDTVSTVGWVWNPKSFRNTAFNPSIRYARHAIALDERRAFFRQNRLGPDWEKSLPGSSEPETEEAAAGKPLPPQPRILEYWFPGVHCDVGGGYEGEEDQLWPLALGWMLGEAAAAGLHIDPVRRRLLPQLLRDDVHRAKQHESLAKWWRLAEYFPSQRWRKDPETKKWRPYFTLGRGAPRRVRPGELLHPSVVSRLRAGNVTLPDDRQGPYEPRSLCRAFCEKIRRGVAPPSAASIEYRPEKCGCEACR